MAIGNHNYSLVSDAVFNPRSFDDMMKPWALYKAEYDKIQEGLGELDSKASVWESLANQEKDPLAYAQYKTYADNLKKQANDFAVNGMNTASKANLMALKGDYSKRIVPIEASFTKRAELEKTQRDALAANPTMMYERMASNMSLDDFILDPAIDYGQSYSGALLTKQVSEAVDNLAKELHSGGISALRSLGLTGQYYFLEKHGYTRQNVMEAIKRSGNGDKILKSIVDDAIKSSGIGAVDLNNKAVGPGWGSLTDRIRALKYAQQGLWDAVGETSVKTVKDEDLIDRLKERRKAKAGTPLPDTANNPIDWFNLYGSNMDMSELLSEKSAYDEFNIGGLLNDVMIPEDTQDRVKSMYNDTWQDPQFNARMRFYAGDPTRRLNNNSYQSYVELPSGIQVPYRAAFWEDVYDEKNNPKLDSKGNTVKKLKNVNDIISLFEKGMRAGSINFMKGRPIKEKEAAFEFVKKDIKNEYKNILKTLKEAGVNKRSSNILSTDIEPIKNELKQKYTDRAKQKAVFERGIPLQFNDKEAVLKNIIARSATSDGITPIKVINGFAGNRFVFDNSKTVKASDIIEDGKINGDISDFLLVPTPFGKNYFVFRLNGVEYAIPSNLFGELASKKVKQAVEWFDTNSLALEQERDDLRAKIEAEYPDVTPLEIEAAVEYMLKDKKSIIDRINADMFTTATNKLSQTNEGFYEKPRYNTYNSSMKNTNTGTINTEGLTD